MANQSYLDFNTNPSNPFFLHSNENPALVLVTPLLNGKNYHTWARSMKLAMYSKNKMKFLDGSLSSPSPDEVLHGPWTRSAEVWKDLQDRFSQGDIFRIAELQEDFYRLHQGNLSVSDFFTQLKTIWEEIENFRPIGSCKCASVCSCGIIDTVKTYRDQDYVIRFLKGLNEQYAQVRSQIMLIDPLPTINKVFSMLIQQERQMNNPVLDIDSKILSANTGQYSFNNGNNSFQGSRGRSNQSYRGRGGRFSGTGRGQTGRFCTHCQRTNHTIDTCFLKHGFPPGFNSNKSTRMANHATGFPLDTDENQSSDQHNQECLVSKQSPSFAHSFTDDQIKGILDLLSQSKGDNNHVANSIVNTAIPSSSSNISTTEYFKEDDWYS